jgi:transcription termination factor Rho
VATIRRYELRTATGGGQGAPARDTDKFAALLYVETVNGRAAEEGAERLSFDNLVPVYPSRRIVLESDKDSSNWPMRIVNLIAPIGFGQRAMIVAPPETGKTVLLKELSKAIKQNDENAHVMMLLIDERPEAVTEIRDSVGADAEVFASTFDIAPESQTRASETMLERAQRLVEQGQDVVILLDSLTKLTRAYQATLTQGGRAMTNTVTPAALVRPKRFFGAARNTRDGGSLTVIATILVETGSRVDDIIFEEFKGTANMELWLDLPEGNDPMFPVIDMQRSGTKKEDMLLSDQEIEGLRAIRTVLGSTTNREALIQLIELMSKTKDNTDLLHRLQDWVTMWEKSGFLIRK